MRAIDADKLMDDFRDTITENSTTIDWINLINRQSEISRWIPVGDKLPSNGSYSLTMCFVDMRHKGYKNSFRRILKWDTYDDCWKYENGKRLADCYEVIAWQPLIYPDKYEPVSG